MKKGSFNEYQQQQQQGGINNNNNGDDEIKSPSYPLSPSNGILKKSKSNTMINNNMYVGDGTDELVNNNRTSGSNSPTYQQQQQQRIFRTPISSTEDLYQVTTKNQQQQQQQQSYHSPSYSRVIPVTDSIMEEDSNGGVGLPPTIMINSQVSTSNRNNVLSNSGGISMPQSLLTTRRTHKRSNSHGPPSRSTPTNITHNVYSPPNINNNNNGGSEYHLPPSSNQYQQIPSPPNTARSLPPSSSSHSKSHRTWSPSRLKMNKHILESIKMLGDNVISPTPHHPSQQQQQPSQPHLSPSNQQQQQRHRRTVSWEAPESLETLSQIIKEKRGALMMRERELLAQQMALDQSIRSSNISSSPPKSDSIISYNNINNATNNNDDISPITLSSSPSLPQNLHHGGVAKHNRSKSDTNTLVHHLMKRQQQAYTHHGQQQQTLPSQHSPPNVVVEGSKMFYPVANTGSGETRHSTVSPTNLSKSPKVLTPSGDGSRSPRNVNNQIPKHSLYSSTTTTTTTTSTTSSPIQLTTPTPKEYSNPHSSYSRRKSVDPMLYVGGLKPVNPGASNSGARGQNYYYNNHNNNSNNVMPMGHYGSTAGIGMNAVSSRIGGGVTGGVGGGSGGMYHNQHSQANQQQYSNHQNISNQYFDALMHMDLEELEEEIDKEIQLAIGDILSTTTIQDKVGLLERVRCTAPGPLCMLFGDSFGDNYNSSSNNNNNSSNNNNNNNKNISPPTLSIPGKKPSISSPKTPTNSINSSSSSSSPFLVHYPPTSFTDNNLLYDDSMKSSFKTVQNRKPTNQQQQFNNNQNQNQNYHQPSLSSSISSNQTNINNNSSSRAPDRTKSKNLSSSLRSSAFSPPPRP